MTYYGDQVERLRSSADLLKVADRYGMRVQKAGGSWKACCPFHEERTPSFVLYTDSASYHCYGCGAHGSAIDLVQHYERCEFHRAVEILAGLAGIQLEDLKPPKDAPKAGDSDRLLAACEWACSWYEARLRDCPEALAYLREQRHLSDDAIRRHRLGWAPAGDQLCAAAAAAGIPQQDLLDADLAHQVEGRVRDSFWQRVTIPIRDERERPVAFSCRILPADEANARELGKDLPKYTNSRETPLFKKGRSVFNLARARSAARVTKRLLVMEGALDVIAADQAGHPEACAPLGTALTTDQAALITRGGIGDARIILCLDGDQAGKQATAKAVRALLPTCAPIRVASLPGGADPSELLVEDGASAESKAAFAESLDQAAPGLTYLLDTLLPADLKDDEVHRLRVLDQVIDVVGGMGDEELRDSYLESAAKRVGLAAAAAKRRAQKKRDSSAKAPPPGGGPGEQPTKPAWQKRYELNETGNSQRFRDRYQKDVRFCHTWGVWLLWRGTHWEIDQVREVERLMATAIRESCLRDMADCGNDDMREELRRWWVKNLNDRGICNSVRRAESLVELSITADQLDRDPWLLSVQNGTIDLRTSELRQHHRDDFITRLTPVPYEPTAASERWSLLVNHLSSHDPEVAAFLQRSAGYAITGDTRTQAVFLFTGRGGAGKSTFVSTILSILGDYGISLDFELFLSNNNNRRWELADASQCRLVVCEESEEGKAFNAALVKKASGGNPISAERKGKQPFRYLPRFKMWFLCNEAPYVSDRDSGWWRRCHRIHCDLVPAKPDLSLGEHLTTDHEARKGVLAWLVAGARLYVEQGLSPPEAVQLSTQAYRDEQDNFSPYLVENCMRGNDEDHLSCKDFIERYHRWCQSNGVKSPYSRKGIALRLAVHGVKSDAYIWNSDTGHSDRAYTGIRWRCQNDPPPDVNEWRHRIPAAASTTTASDAASWHASDGGSASEAVPQQPEANRSAHGNDTDAPLSNASPSTETASWHASGGGSEAASEAAGNTVKTDAPTQTPPIDPRALRARAREAPSTDNPLPSPPRGGNKPKKIGGVGGGGPSPPREPGADEDEPPWPTDPPTSPGPSPCPPN